MAGEVEVLISSLILEEVGESLRDDFGLVEEEIESRVSQIQSHAILILPEEEISVTPDEADNRILDRAVQGEVQYLVTGDRRHLLPLKEFQGVRIVSPAEFLEILASAT